MARTLSIAIASLTSWAVLDGLPATSVLTSPYGTSEAERAVGDLSGAATHRALPMSVAPSAPAPGAGALQTGSGGGSSGPSTSLLAILVAAVGAGGLLRRGRVDHDVVALSSRFDRLVTQPG